MQLDPASLRRALHAAVDAFCDSLEPRNTTRTDGASSPSESGTAKPAARPPERAIPLALWVGVKDVTHALGCSREKAYQHLRGAAGRAPGVRGQLRVRVDDWQRYEEALREKTASGRAAGGRRPKGRGAAAPQKRGSDRASAAPLIPKVRAYE